MCYEYGTQTLEFWKEGFTDNNENLKKKKKKVDTEHTGVDFIFVCHSVIHLILRKCNHGNVNL